MSSRIPIINISANEIKKYRKVTQSRNDKLRISETIAPNKIARPPIEGVNPE